MSVMGHRLQGHLENMGDIIVQTRWIVKGLQRPQFIWHIGSPKETTPDQRVVRGVAQPASGRVDLIVDLMADKGIDLSPGWTDEVGNPVTTPPDPTTYTVVYTVDNPAVINLTDNGDGTGFAAATGTLGTATVHGEVNFINGDVQTGDLQINVVPGLAERFNIVAGEPREVTPDV